MMLTPAQWREGSLRAHALARREPERHLKRFLAAHALALAQLAERIERELAQDPHRSGRAAPGEGEGEAS